MGAAYKRLFLLILLTMLLTSCATNEVRDGPPANRISLSQIESIPNAKPRYLPRSRYGNPSSYVVNGKRYYVLRSALGYNERGIASWYGTKFNGKLTSSREPYNMLGMTAASPTLPIPTFVRVTNLENGRWVIVKVNDRGPFAPNRIIDLSYAAAIKLGYEKKGTALVDVAAINPANPNAIQAVPRIQHPHLYLQLGAFADFNNAKRLQYRVEQLTSRRVLIRTTSYHGRALYRVQIGPLVGVGESDALQATIAQDGLGQAITVIG